MKSLATERSETITSEGKYDIYQRETLKEIPKSVAMRNSTINMLEESSSDEEEDFRQRFEAKALVT